MITLDRPAKFSETTAVLCPVPCDHRFDVDFAKFPALRVGVVSAIGVNDLGFPDRPAAYTANCRNRIDQRRQLGNVVAARAGQDGTEGSAIGIDEDVMSGTGSRATGGIRAGCSPAPTARADDESTAGREKSGCPDSCNFASSSSYPCGPTPGTFRKCCCMTGKIGPLTVAASVPEITKPSRIKAWKNVARRSVDALPQLVALDCMSVSGGCGISTRRLPVRSGTQDWGDSPFSGGESFPEMDYDAISLYR